MKIELQQLVRPVFLRDYAEEYGEQVIYVWANPPRRLRLDYFEVTQEFGSILEERGKLVETEPPDVEALATLDRRLEELSRRIYGWFASLWSQDADPETHWTADEVVELVEACQDADPRLWSWLQDETWRVMAEHRDGVKKS